MSEINAGNTGIPQSFTAFGVETTQQATSEELVFNRDLPHSLFPDAMMSAGAIKVPEKYTNPSSDPTLPKPMGKEAAAENFLEKLRSTMEVPAEAKEEIAEYFSSVNKEAKSRLSGDQRYIPRKKDAAQAYARFFESALKNVPEEMRSAIRYAHYNPERAKGLTSEQFRLLQQTQMAAKGEFRLAFNTPANFEPGIDNYQFNTQTSLRYSDGYVSHLKDLNRDGKITDSEFKGLKALHYHPEYALSGKEKLQEMQQKIEGKFKEEFIKENALPEDWEGPKVESLPFDAYADGLFRDTFEKKLLSKNDLSVDEKKAAVLALANPANAAEGAKETSRAIEKEAVSEVREKMGLPATWEPKEKTVKGDADPTQRMLAKNGMKYVQDSVDMAEKYAKSLPADDPNRPLLLQYLKAVGQALDILTQMLYLIENSNSKSGKLLSAMMQDMQLNKIESWKKEVMEYRKEREEAQEEAESGKGGFFGAITNFMKSLGPIGTVISAIVATISAPMFGPQAALIVWSMAAAQLAEEFGGQDLVAKMFNSLMGFVDKMLPAETPDFIQTIVHIHVKLMLLGHLLPAMAAAGPSGLEYSMDLIFKSEIVADSVKAAGGDEEMQRKVTMIVMVTAAVVAAVGMIVASLVTGGSGSAGAMSGILSSAKGAAQALQTAGTTLTNMGRASLQAIKSLQETAVQLTKATLNLIKEAAKQIKEGMKLVEKASKLIKDAAKLMQQAEASGNTFQMQIALDKLEKGRKLMEEGQNLIRMGQEKLAVAQKMAGNISPVDKTQHHATITQNLSKGQELINKANAEGISKGLFMQGDKLNKSIKQFEQVEKWGGYLQRGAGFTMGAVEGTQGIYTAIQAREQMKLFELMAEMTLLMAKEKAYQEEVDALITMLKQLITTLINSLGGIAEFINDVNKLQSKKFENAGVTWAV